MPQRIFFKESVLIKGSFTEHRHNTLIGAGLDRHKNDSILEKWMIEKGKRILNEKTDEIAQKNVHICTVFCAMWQML